MDSFQARARLRVGDAEIEIEGPEDFVRDQLQEFGDRLLARSAALEDLETGEFQPAETERGAINTINPSLRDFHLEKEPEGHFETVPVIAFYLKQFEGVEEVTEEVIEAAYDELGIRKPSRVRQTLADIRSKKNWLTSGSRPGLYRLTNPGANFVQHDLPKRKSV